MTQANRKVPNALDNIGLETGNVIALVALAFFLGMIVQKVWSYGVVACWWPL